ncbi:hypothetical protein BS78_04G142200 [Paspalum vaginatum]|nr:hypothetical protein BS78_04G142200 [Paspalum vaginatum]
MFVIGVSYQALLEAVAGRCSLEYAGFVREVTEDGTVLCGVELVWLLLVDAVQDPRSIFGALFKALSVLPMSKHPSKPFLTFSVYAFLIVDYSFQGLVWYRGVARAAVNAGARADRLATLLCIGKGGLSLVRCSPLACWFDVCIGYAP